MKGFFSSRKFRQGTMATAITVVFIGLIIAVNLVATALTQKYSLTLDLTENKVASITEETKEFLRGLDKDVTITLMSSQEDFLSGGDYYVQALEVLKKYEQESPRVHLAYQDLVANPAFAQQYPDLQLFADSILVTSGDRVRDITAYQLYDIQSDQYGNSYVAASKAEQTLTSAILSVTSDSLVKVAMVEGHDENPLAGLKSLLESNNYLLDPVDIRTGDISDEFDVAVIAAPYTDYSEEELKKLDRFLENGGQYGKTLLYFASADQENLANLEAFLADWGVAVEPGIVYETNPAMYMSQDPFLTVMEYSDTDQSYSGQLRQKQAAPLMAYGRPLTVLFESKNNITTQTLLRASATAGIATVESLKPEVGPMAQMILSRVLSGDGSKGSQVLACAAVEFVDQSLLAEPGLANSEYMLNILSTLTGKEEQVMVQTKAVGSATLNLSAVQALLTGVILTVVFPLAVLITGIVVWARRRHR